MPAFLNFFYNYPNFLFFFFFKQICHFFLYNFSQVHHFLSIFKAEELVHDKATFSYWLQPSSLCLSCLLPVPPKTSCKDRPHFHLSAWSCLCPLEALQSSPFIPPLPSILLAQFFPVLWWQRDLSSSWTELCPVHRSCLENFPQVEMKTILLAVRLEKGKDKGEKQGFFEPLNTAVLWKMPKCLPQSEY